MNEVGTSNKVSTFLGWLAIAAGALCIVTWVMNLIGWIRWGSPVGQAIIGPVCIALGLMLLNRKPKA